MIFEKIKDEINQYINQVLKYYGLRDNELIFEISETPNKEFGDFSTNVAFSLSKILKMNPVEIAKNIVSDILPGIITKYTKERFVDSYSFEKPGFINFKINLKYFLNYFFLNINELNSLPKIDNNKGLILIEHTSVNPNKALHVGHIRNLIIGDSLYRMLRSFNYQVKVLNYVDDSGLQVADIIVGLKYAGFSTHPEKTEKFDHYCGNYVYVKINELYSTRPDLEIKRKEVLKELEDPNSEISLYTKEIVRMVLQDQLHTCWRLKCHYDILNFESQIIQSNLWSSIFNTLKDNNIIQFEVSGQNSGCWIFKSKSEGDKVLVRSDSTITYFAKDIPYAAWKLGFIKNPFEFKVFSQQWDSTNLLETKLKMEKNHEILYNSNINPLNAKKIIKVITVIDFRQERLQNILLEILEKLGIEKSKYNYLGYEPVALSKNTAELLGVVTDNKKITQMSGRKGIFIEADSALDMLEEKSYEEVKKRNPDLTEKEIKYISKEIAISAIRYFFIKHDIGKTIIFDIKDSLSLEGDTGPYIQYSYARGNKVFNKLTNIDKIQNQSTELDGSDKDFDLNEIEVDLIKHLCKFSMVLKDSVTHLEPKIIAKYLFNLSTLFNNFYESSPILREEIEHTIKQLRIKILVATLDVMKYTMNLIGITPLEKM